MNPLVDVTPLYMQETVASTWLLHLSRFCKLSPMHSQFTVSECCVRSSWSTDCEKAAIKGSTNFEYSSYEHSLYIYYF